MTGRSAVALGDQAEDRISGFRGVVTGIADYITGCRQACLSPRVGADGKIGDSHWFDVERLMVTQPRLVDLSPTAAPTGGPCGPGAAAPTR